jgi:hypothetical protein
VALRACGPVGLWACGPVSLWACGPVGLWACGPVGQGPAHSTNLICLHVCTYYYQIPTIYFSLQIRTWNMESMTFHVIRDIRNMSFAIFGIPDILLELFLVFFFIMFVT